MQVTFSAAALSDIDHIYRHIARDNPTAARRLVVQIVATCDQLDSLPMRGRLGRVAGTRELTIVWPYVISYRIAPGVVEILNVWHGAQHRV